MRLSERKRKEREVFERLGVLSDRADNYWHAVMLPLPAAVHADQLRAGMAYIRDELREIFREATGENPWEGQ